MQGEGRGELRACVGRDLGPVPVLQVAVILLGDVAGVYWTKYKYQVLTSVSNVDCGALSRFLWTDLTRDIQTWCVAPIQLTEEISLHLRGNGVVSDSDGVAGGVETGVTRGEGELPRQDTQQVTLQLTQSPFSVSFYPAEAPLVCDTF